MFSLDAGVLERKEQLLEASLEKWGSEQGSDCHVATLQRRDVSSRSAPYHLKYEWFRNQGIGRRTNEGTEFQSRREDGDLEEVPGLRIVSHFLWILEECFLYQTLSSFHSLCSRSIPRVTSNPIICDGLKFDLLYYSIVY